MYESSRWTHSAIHYWVITALRELLTKLLILRFCLIHLKNNST